LKLVVAWNLMSGLLLRVQAPHRTIFVSRPISAPFIFIALLVMMVIPHVRDKKEQAVVEG
jgi:hypothetical protein